MGGGLERFSPREIGTAAEAKAEPSREAAAEKHGGGGWGVAGRGREKEQVAAID